MCGLGDFVKDYQTIIVGVIGFTGVIATLITNAWLQRKQHTRQVEHERTTLKAALHAELTIIREAYVDRIKMIKESESTGGRGMLVPVETMTDVYSQSIDRIGLLTTEQVTLVMGAYLLIRDAPVRLRVLSRMQDVQPRAEIGYIGIGSNKISLARQMHENFLGDIEKAIAALQ